MNPDTSFCKKIEKSVPYRHPKAVWPKPNQGKFGPFRMPFGTLKVPNWVLEAECTFVYGCHLISPSTVSWLVLVPRHVFNLCLWFFFFFSLLLIIQAFLKTIILNNYLVDKSLKINLDKVQIIHNFIVIQSSFLFLCMRPYFKH